MCPYEVRPIVFVLSLTLPHKFKRLYEEDVRF